MTRAPDFKDIMRAVSSGPCQLLVWLHDLCPQAKSTFVVDQQPATPPRSIEPRPVPPPASVATESSPPPQPPQPAEPPPAPSIHERLAPCRVEEWVELYDEIERVAENPGSGLNTAELGGHVLSRMREILERQEIEIIEEPAPFDRMLHQPLPGEVAPPTMTGTMRASVVSPGFRIGRRVLRRARVRLDQPEDEPTVEHDKSNNEASR